MAMLDGLRVVFLEAISFADAKSREKMVKQWNEQCQEVYKYKNDLIAEEHYKATHNADVVPKSEVEELIREYESLAKTVNEASELIRKLRSNVEKSKVEVAREIFEEIEKYFYNNEHKTGVLLYCNFFNIKKKYVE